MHVNRKAHRVDFNMREIFVEECHVLFGLKDCEDVTHGQTLRSLTEMTPRDLPGQPSSAAAGRAFQDRTTGPKEKGSTGSDSLAT